MKTPRPTARDIDELLAFLPRLYADGFTPIRKWGGGTKTPDGAVTVLWPEYEEVVGAFFAAASKPCWCDCDYDPVKAGRMLRDPSRVEAASLAEIKTLLTLCVRGERFCDGYWGDAITSGAIRRLLQRLGALRAAEGAEP